MYVFRRAAARAVAAPRQIRIAPRVSSFRSSIPSLSRTFHQSRIWRAEEQKSEAEPTSSATASRSGASSDVDAVSESSGTTSEPLGQSEHQTESPSESISEKASDLAQKAQETASDIAAKAAQAVGEFSPSTDKIQETASEATESVKETASQAAESAQQTASSIGRQTRDAVDANQPFKSHGDAAATKILYVGNLFFEVTAPQLEAEFAKYGEVTNSRVVTDNRGLSKGFAYIEFATQEEANEALEALDQKVFQGRRLAVQYHKRRAPGGKERANREFSGSNAPSKTLFIGNMSYQMSDKDLNDLFRQIKNVLDVRVAIDRRSGQPRGFAHADFIDVESAVRAKDILAKKSVYGRQLRVDFSGQTGSRSDGDRPDRGSRYEPRDGDSL